LQANKNFLLIVNLIFCSRRVSEAVSPSELPDSPRQMAPPQQLPFYRPEPPTGSKLKEEDMDTVKIFATTGESRTVSGVQSVRSLSPLTIDDGDGGDTKIGLMEPMKMDNPKV